MAKGLCLVPGGHRTKHVWTIISHLKFSYSGHVGCAILQYSRLVWCFGREHLCVHCWITTWRWKQYISPKQWYMFNPEGVLNCYNFNPLKFFLNLLMHFGKSNFTFPLYLVSSTAQLHLSGLIGAASHLDMQKIRIIGLKKKKAIFSVWSSAVTIYSMYLCLNLSTTPYLKF